MPLQGRGGIPLPSKKQLTMENNYAAVLKQIISGGTIAYHAIFAKAFKSAPTGIFLSQAYFWQENAKHRTAETHRQIEGKTFFCKTAADWEEETGLSLEQQMKLRDTLRKVDVLREKKIGLPAQLFMHIDFENLVLVLNHYLQTGKSVLVDNRAKNRFKTKPSNGLKPEQHPVKNQDNYIESLESSKESLKESLAENEFPQSVDGGLRVTVIQGHSEVLPPVAKKKKKVAPGAGDGVIQAMVTAFETEHRQHFKDAGGEWIGFTWQAKEFPALNSIRAELEKRYRQKLNAEPTPENIVESWAMFLGKAAKCDKFILDNLFTPSKIWGQFQSIVQKIHTNNGRPPSTTSNGRPDQNERNRIAAEKMVQDVLEGRV